MEENEVIENTFVNDMDEDVASTELAETSEEEADDSGMAGIALIAAGAVAVFVAGIKLADPIKAKLSGIKAKFSKKGDPDVTDVEHIAVEDSDPKDSKNSTAKVK